jgi:hypothetical protein
LPNLVPGHPDADGAALTHRAWQRRSTQWQGQSFMAVAMKDPLLGPAAMARLRAWIRGWPLPYEVSDAGHFVQESGDVVARAARSAFQAPPGG